MRAGRLSRAVIPAGRAPTVCRAACGSPFDRLPGRRFGRRPIRGDSQPIRRPIRQPVAGRLVQRLAARVDADLLGVADGR
jgi:hypothetical protein